MSGRSTPSIRSGLDLTVARVLTVEDGRDLLATEADLK
jgi:hypothetical protein